MWRTPLFVKLTSEEATIFIQLYKRINPAEVFFFLLTLKVFCTSRFCSGSTILHLSPYRTYFSQTVTYEKINCRHINVHAKPAFLTKDNTSTLLFSSLKLSAHATLAHFAADNTGHIKGASNAFQTEDSKINVHVDHSTYLIARNSIVAVKSCKSSLRWKHCMYTSIAIERKL